MAVAGRWQHQPRPEPLLWPGLAIPGQPKNTDTGATNGRLLLVRPSASSRRIHQDATRGGEMDFAAAKFHLRHEQLRLASDLYDAHAAWWKPYISSNGGGTAQGSGNSEDGVQERQHAQLG